MRFQNESARLKYEASERAEGELAPERLRQFVENVNRAGIAAEHVSVAWILKARREQRALADVMREHGEAGSPEFNPQHPFWAGCEAPDRLPSLDELRELQAAARELTTAAEPC